MNLVHEVARAGIEWSGARYVTVQIDHDTWREVRETAQQMDSEEHAREIEQDLKDEAQYERSVRSLVGQV